MTSTAKIAINCGQVVGAHVQPGFKYIDLDGRQMVRLGTEAAYLDLQLVMHSGRRPQVNSAWQRVVYAAPHPDQRQRNLITGNLGGFRGGMLRCAARDVKLPFEPIARSMSTRWVGFERAHIYAQFGDPANTAVRDQLAVMPIRAETLIVDPDGAVGAVAWNGERFSQIRALDLAELVQYLHDLGLAARELKTARWAAKSLRELGHGTAADAVERQRHLPRLRAVARS